MHNPIEFEAWHQHREELARQVAWARHSRRPRRAGRRPLNALVGRLAARATGAPRAAG